MNIKNLSQLKKELQKGKRFIVINHQKPELVDQIREVNKVQTNALYVVVADNPEHEWSTCNGRKGVYMKYNKASHYQFNEESIKWYKLPIGSDNNCLIMEFKLV